MPFGCISAFRSVFAWWRSCWPRAALLSATKPYGKWAHKFGQQFANQIRRRLPRAGDKWHLDEVVLNISGMKHWLWRAVDQSGMVLDVLVQRRNEQIAAEVERASEPDRDTVPPTGENATLASETPGDTTRGSVRPSAPV
jgi:DDE domain